MIGKNERKKRIRKIGVLVVFGIFAALMLAQPVAAANYDTGGNGYVGNGAAERIFFDNTNGEIEILGAPVGIGDTSPDFKLEVTGTSGSGYFGVTSVSDGDIFIITSGGNVGIGITTFSTKFHVLQTSAADAFRVDDAVSDLTPLIIDQYGNVGIGTSSPGAKLDVELLETEGGAATIGGAGNSATADYAIALGDATTASGTSSIAMGFDTTASGYASTTMGMNTIASSWCSVAMGYVTTASGFVSTAIGREIEARGDYTVAIALSDQNGLQVTQANTMAIMGGKVGIGTVSPDKLLHLGDDTENINGEIRFESSDGDLVDLGITTNDQFYIIGGNVGIGTTNPQRPLHISDVMRLEPRSSAPSSPSEGDIYVSSTDHQIYCYLNSDWRALYNP